MFEMINEKISLGRTLFEKIGSEKVKQNLLQALPFLVGSVITGLIAVVYTRLFALAGHRTAYIYHHCAYLFLLITPCCFVLSWWVVKKFSPYARAVEELTKTHISYFKTALFTSIIL